MSLDEKRRQMDYNNTSPGQPEGNNREVRGKAGGGAGPKKFEGGSAWQRAHHFISNILI